MVVKTFHIRKGKARTTVSLERTLADLLSLQLCGRFDGAQVTKWCQEQVDEDPGAYEKGASQRLISKAVLAVAPKDLRERYWDLVMTEKRPSQRHTRRHVPR